MVTSCASARYKEQMDWSRYGAIMLIGFFVCFHGISLERSRFRKSSILFFRFA